MTDQPRLPGYRVIGVAGVGGGSAVWTAETPGGERVAIRTVRPESTTEREVLVRRYGALRGLSHPALAPLRERRELPGGQIALVSAMVEGPTLATMHTARRGLSAPECLALARAMLDGVTHLHEAGIVHADVAPANVVLVPDDDTEGAGSRAHTGSAPRSQGAKLRPVLVDLLGIPGRERGTPGFAAPEVRCGAAPGAPADVYSIATTAIWAAAPGERSDVRSELKDLLDQDPARRPSAAAAAYALADQRAAIAPADADTLAAATLREHAARASTTTVPARRQRRRGRHRRSRPRAWVAAFGGVAVVVLSAVLGSGAGMDAPAGPSRLLPRTAGSGTDAVRDSRVVELTAIRDEALVSGDSELLATVTVPGSPAAERDAAVLESLQQAGERVAGLASEVSEVEVLEVNGTASQVRAVITQTAHERIDPTGAVRSVPAQRGRCTELSLSRHVGEWRVADVAAC
ncbi:protein kinase domain-containing protein [Ruania halotolerans]|uniref:protein kinase domain-containing protein n=1 Tax=Ruania halotolerans TaxID=2897773 RepID=UPI001E52C848|nr:protein kinase [Ruania halotolerans]UFU04851.1 protein kinase [Ruania halotolerans]